MEHMTWEEFNDSCDMIVEAIKKYYPFKFKNIYGIPRGGLVLAVRLSHLLDLPIIIHKTKIGQNTLIVDDIADTGKTLDLHSHRNIKIANISVIYTN